MTASLPPDEWTAPRNRLAGFAKRTLDVVGAIVTLILTFPLWPLIALAIVIDSPGPVIFRQKRVGLGGRSFTIWKFRSMVKNAEELLPQLLDLEALDSPVFKLENDPRVTRVGHLLRRTSVDELPQLLNVLAGDMSLVGPRPEEPWLIERYPACYLKRLAVKPGMTGPMQVNGRADLLLDQRLALELRYIQSYSLWQDCRILLRTIPAVILGRGAR